MGVTPRPLPDRFWAKVDMSGGPSACWLWRGAMSEKRNATFRGAVCLGGRRGRVLLAHRVALWLKDDPTAQDISGYDRPEKACHVNDCHRLCCNPAHLYWGSPAENVEDRVQAAAARLAALAAEIVAELDRDLPAPDQ